MFRLIMKTLRNRKMLPRVSETERAALDAGTVWIDGEFFRGDPDFYQLLAEAYPPLTPEEQALVDGPTREVCRQVDPWQLSLTRELPEKVLQYLREQGFYGFNVPEEYGGTPAGALAKSVIMGMLAPATGAVSTIVVIPNSLGPAELLVDYGTEAQKAKYLPRLASGELTPCFGLTELTAGSDAASIKAEALAFKDSDGEIKLRLNFRKRYITLAPIADIASIAVQLHDPENLLGQGEWPGITVVLVERGTPGFELGRHHEPITPFPNGPLIGKDVVVPVSNIIGGIEYAGKGWRMLMETLSGGRAISIPAGAIGAAQHAAAVAGPYSMIREQFGIPVGVMEGVQEKVAKLAALNYALEAGRTFGCAAIDRGQRPPVISAIMKYRFTDLAQELIIDAMDVLSGAGVMRGPNNTLAESYIGAPVAITVEGANILTRTLIVFGQGAVRCHPYALRVLDAVEQDDVDAFRDGLLGWTKHFVTTFGRATLRGMTRGWTVSTPVSGPTAVYYRRLGWASTRFALLTDLALLGIGGRLKARGNLTGRYADVLSWLYLGTATLRRFEAEGRRAEDLPLVSWSLDYILEQIQQAFDGIYANFDVPILGALLRGPGRWWLRINPLGLGVRDRQHAAAARTIQQPGEQFQRLMQYVYLPDAQQPGLGRILHAFELVSAAAPVLQRIRQAQKNKQLPRGRPAEQLASAVAAGIITQAEADQVAAAEAARLKAIEVDDFAPEEYTRRTNTEQLPPPRQAAAE